jgi:hypothetical protein
MGMGQVGLEEIAALHVNSESNECTAPMTHRNAANERVKRQYLAYLTEALGYMATETASR